MIRSTRLAAIALDRSQVSRRICPDIIPSGALVSVQLRPATLFYVALLSSRRSPILAGSKLKVKIKIPLRLGPNIIYVQ